MKFLKSEYSKKHLNNGRFVYIKLNDDIDKILQKDSENEKKSAKERLNDGKRTAMNALPSWANEITDQITGGKGLFAEKWHTRESRSGKFLEAIRGNRSVESVQKAVRSSIFEIIDNDIDQRENNLSPRLRNLMTDIEKNQSRAENTIGDVEQAMGVVGKLSDALKSQLDRIQRYQKSDNARKHWWAKWKRKQSDLDIFNQRRQVVEGALSKINQELSARKAETTEDITKSAKIAREEFDDLSPEDQMLFRKQMNLEIQKNKNYHKEFAVNNKLEQRFVLGVMSNQPLHRRLEIYKLAQLDESAQNRDLLSATTKFQAESVRFHQANEEFKEDLKKVKNLDDLKKNFSKGIDKSEIKPHNDLKGLVKDLEEFFRGIYGESLKAKIWENYPENFELTDLQKFTSFLVALENGSGDPAKKVPKSLRIKLLGYLEHINTEENGEELGAYSVEFVEAEESAKTGLEDAKTALEKLYAYKDLSAIDDKVLKEINNDSYKITLKVDELKEIAKDLTGKEKITLEKYIQTLEDAATSLTKIRGIWIEEIKEFEKEEREYNKKKTELEAERDRFKKIMDAMENDKSKFIVTKDTTPAVGFIKSTSSDKKEINPKYQEYRDKFHEMESKLKQLGVLEKDSAKFTKFSTKITHELKNLEKHIKTIEATTRSAKNDKINDNIVQFLERQANNDVHEQSKAEFQKLQGEMLTNLAKKGLGSQVILLGERYQSGNPPTLENLARNSNQVQHQATIWAKSDNLVILRSENNVIVIQKSETGNIEMIGFEVPESMTEKDAVIDEFRKKKAANATDFVASPTAILPEGSPIPEIRTTSIPPKRRGKIIPINRGVSHKIAA